MPDILQAQEFNQKLPTVIYIHGYLEDGEFGYSAERLRDAFLHRNDHNFIAVDWSAFSRYITGLAYFGNIPKLKEVN